MGVVTVGSTLYVVGGEDANGPTASVLAFDIGLRDQPVAGKTAQWTPKAPLPEPRANLAVAVLDGKIYAVGGERDGAPVAPPASMIPATDSLERPAAAAGRADQSRGGGRGRQTLRPRRHDRCRDGAIAARPRDRLRL